MLSNLVNTWMRCYHTFHQIDRSVLKVEYSLRHLFTILLRLHTADKKLHLSLLGPVWCFSISISTFDSRFRSITTSIKLSIHHEFTFHQRPYSKSVFISLYFSFCLCIKTFLSSPLMVATKQA